MESNAHGRCSLALKQAVRLATLQKATIPALLLVQQMQNQEMRIIKFKPKMSPIALSIGLLLLTPLVNAANPSVQQQLEILTHQLEQQQKMMQKMQQQLDEQSARLHAKGQEINEHIIEGEQKIHTKVEEIGQHIATDEQKIDAREQELDQKAAIAEGDAQLALEEVKAVAKASGVALSKEMFRYNAKGTTIKVPKARTELTIGGFIRASVIHDFNAIESPYKFSAKDIVVNSQPAGVPDKRTTLTANASRLFFSTATPFEIGQLTTFFSFDLAGSTTSSGAEFSFRQGWAQLDDFIFGGNLRVGQAWSTWDDVDVLPETMDFEGPNGSQQNRQPLIRWERDYAKAYLFQLALENPSYNINNGSTSSGWPDSIVAFSWHQDWGHLRSAFIGRHIRGNDSNGHGGSTFGWGLQASGEIKTTLLHEKDNVKFQMAYGAATGSYNNDGYDDAIFTTNGELRTVNAFQGFGSMQHWWTNSIRSTTVFGWVDMDNNSSLRGSDLNRTFYASGNLVWSPFTQVDIGLEYLWGQRRNMNHDIGSANRIQATTHFSF